MKRAWAIFAITLTIYTLTAGGHLYSPDEEIVFRVAQSLSRGEGFAIDPIDPSGFGTRKPKEARDDGRQYAQYGIGQPILAVPFVWAGQILSKFGSDASWQQIYPIASSAKAQEIAPRWACSWFNILVGAMLATLVFLIALELTGNITAASWVALLYAFGTMAWPHSRPFFTEPLAAFCIALAWYAQLRAVRGRVLRWLVVAGAAAGFAALVRMDSVLFYPGLAVMMLFPVVARAREVGRPVWMAWGAFCVPALFCGAVMLGMNWALYGSPLATGYSDQPEGVKFSTPVIAGLYGLLFSVGRGLWFFSPALVLGLFAWPSFYRVLKQHRRAIMVSLAGLILVPLLTHAQWQNWSGGWCWGPRHIFQIHLFLAIPIAGWIALASPPVARVTCIGMLIIGGAVQLLGVSQNFIDFYRDYYRNPDPRRGFHIQYDPYDQAELLRHFRLYYSSEPMDPDPRFAPPDMISMQRFVLPAPTQDSLYNPPHSAWAAYPKMFRDGKLDNFWMHLLRTPQVEPESP